jgi:hypothetical protein
VSARLLRITRFVEPRYGLGDVQQFAAEVEVMTAEERAEWLVIWERPKFLGHGIARRISSRALDGVGALEPEGEADSGCVGVDKLQGSLYRTHR